MSADPSELMGEMAKHLDLARGLLEQLSGGPKLAPRSGAGKSPAKLQSAPLDQRYQEAERRANVAEVKVAKLQREIEKVRESTSISTRNIQRLAYQDPLTGLGNVHLLHELIDKLLASTSEHRQVLLIMLDIDRFCVINQMLGHDLADDLLLRVSERLLELSDQRISLGRLGEDEFLLVVPDLLPSDDGAQALALGQKVRLQLSRPFMLQGQQIFLTVSQGATVAAGGSGSARELVQQARTALAFAKSQGRDQLRVYNPELDQRMRRDAALEFQLRYALENDEFFVEYLPIIWLEKKSGGKMEGRLIGVEALLRWNHRTEGVLAPGSFLTAAKRSGQIVAIGERILAMICQHTQEWQKAGVDLYVNINLSARQLLNQDFVEKTVREVDRAGVSRGRLTFEIDESFGRLEEERIEQNLIGLHAAGFTLALNNFGEGACSLARLQQVDFLKLSPPLVQGSLDLCRQALVIAAGLSKVAVGVGVENAEMARLLMTSGCSTMQGHYFSKPIKAAEVQTLFHSKPSWKI